MSLFNIASIQEQEKNRAVIGLLGLLKKREVDIKKQNVEITKLKEEIARLKNHPSKPKLKPSIIGKKDKSILNKSKKRSIDLSKKGQDKKKMEIHKTVNLKPENIPEGSKLIKSRPYFVQDIIIKAENIKYLREIWQTPDGKYLRASLPDTVQGHYGNKLRAYMLDLYYGAHVSQGSIAEQLSNMSIHISAGQVNNILTKNHDRFHQEASEILETGLKFSKSICTDDTGLRNIREKMVTVLI